MKRLIASALLLQTCFFHLLKKQVKVSSSLINIIWCSQVLANRGHRRLHMVETSVYYIVQRRASFSQANFFAMITSAMRIL